MGGFGWRFGRRRRRSSDDNGIVVCDIFWTWIDNWRFFISIAAMDDILCRLGGGGGIVMIEVGD